MTVQEVARVLRPQGYFIWLDFTYPKIVKRIFQSLVKNYEIYTWDDIKFEFTRNGLERQLYEKPAFGIFKYHHIVLRKRQQKND